MMMMLKRSPRAVFLAVEREGKDIQEVQSQFKRELQALIRRYERLVKKAIDDGLGAGNKTARLAEVTKILDELDRVLELAGLDELRAYNIQKFRDLTASSLKYFTDAGADLSKISTSIDVFDAYIRHTNINLEKMLDVQLVEPVRSQMFGSVFGGISNQQIYDNIATMLPELSVTRVEQSFNWAVESFQRQVTVETGDRLGLEVYEFVGPSDAITSPQCQAMLEYDEHGAAGFYYKDEITTDLHENLIYPPLTNGGHPGCRHKFLPVTLDYAKSKGFQE
jgi:hypothetical protein